MLKYLLKTFKGGIYPKEKKIGKDIQLQKLKIPPKITIPLKQHIGKECKPTVKINDSIKKYQLIAALNDNELHSNIHSSTSGIVTNITQKEFPIYGTINCIEIKTDGKDESLKLNKINQKNLTLTKFIKIIKDAGIVGLGGAGFPTHKKFDTKDKKIETIIINGCECEPFICSDHRIMLEYSNELIKCLKLLIKITKAKNTIIGIEDNKTNAINKLNKIITKENLKNKIKIKKLKTKYPQGAEKMLIYSTTKKIILENELPINKGIIIINVSTLKAIYDAIFESIPLIERAVSITGDIDNPKNYIVKIGTPIDYLIKQSNNKINNQQILMGGPMMGILTNEINPIIKLNNGITILNKRGIENEEKCMKCGKCITVCPLNLVPSKIALFSKKEMYENAKNLFALNCFECGSCTYICPSKIHLLKHIKSAKNEILKKQNN
ncbi:MAG: electron transport complex subunit RsxC [Nanoarchaeota archaeon]